MGWSIVLNFVFRSRGKCVKKANTTLDHCSSREGNAVGEQQYLRANCGSSAFFVLNSQGAGPLPGALVYLFSHLGLVFLKLPFSQSD